MEAEAHIYRTLEKRFMENCSPARNNIRKTSETRGIVNLFLMEPFKIGGTICRRYNILDAPSPYLKLHCDIYQELPAKRQQKQLEVKNSEERTAEMEKVCGRSLRPISGQQK